MTNSTQPQQQTTIDLKDLFFVLRKNWIVESIIFLLILVAGFAYTFVNTDYYVAHCSMVLNVGISSSAGSAYNDTILSKQYLTTVEDLLSNGDTVKKANKLYADEGITTNSITVSTKEDSLFINVYYKDYDKQAAVDKLEAIIKVCEGLTKSDDKTESIFPAEVYLVKYSDEINVSPASDDNKIRILSGFAAILAVGAYALFMYFVRDRVFSIERLETITGKKNIVTIEEKKDAGKVLPVIGEGESEGSYIDVDLSKLSDTLIYMADGENNKVLQIQSAVSGEGKTTVSTNLAKALGESQRKTLIIDCDFAKPSIHRIFKLRRQVGITDYFKGKASFDDVVKQTGAKNVDLITCGNRISNHTIFFASPKFKAILEEARKKYDFVILDCAPVKALTDYINISPIVDATILVVANDKLSARDIDYTVRELESCKANLIGTVFNFSTVDNRRKYYNNYYYYKKKKNK